MALANHLKTKRVDAGFTVADVARASSVSDKTIRKVENRDINVKKETKVKILKGLEQLTGEKYPYPVVFPQG